MLSESGYVNNQPPAYSNSFTLQLNSDYFYNTPLCAGAATPSQCQGWQQFLFQQGNGGSGSVYMQYWLLNYGFNCPSNWILAIVLGEPDCYMNSTSANVPAQQARACSHYLRASTMRAKLRKPMNSTSSFSNREKILRKPLSLRNNRSISLRFL